MNFVSSSPAASRWQPIALLLVAMVSIQSGASLATHLFPAVGATGATALRLVLERVLQVPESADDLHGSGRPSAGEFGACAGFVTQSLYIDISRSGI